MQQPTESASDPPPNGSSSDVCAICGETSVVYCPRCRLIGYCSHEHRLNHWDSHDKECIVVHPVKIKKIGVNKQRSLVARNLFKSGNLIFLETPIIRGPDDNLLSPDGLRYCFLTSSKQRSTCITCCSMVLDGRACTKCQWPVCSEKCSQDPIHSHMECGIFQGKAETEFNLVKPARFVLILRCLLTKESDPKTWNKILTLETNPASKKLEQMLEEGNPIADKQLRKLYSLEKEILSDVMNQLRHFQLQKRFSRNLVSRVVQILNWNALPMELGMKKENMLLYPRVTIAGHNCSPNAFWCMKGNYQLLCHARVEIGVDQPLTISRVSEDALFMCTTMRQQQLWNLNIHCNCDRCSCPTELGSNFSTVKCIKFEFFDTVKGCTQGNLEPLDPRNSETLWKCQSCHCTRSGRLIHTYMTRIQLELEEAKQAVSPLKYKEVNFTKAKHLQDLLGLQKFISVVKHHEGKTVHKNHALIFEAKCFIIKQLSKGIGEVFTLNVSIKPKIMELLVDAAVQVIKLCDDCLSVISLIVPGCCLRYGEIIFHKQFCLGILLPDEFRKQRSSSPSSGGESLSQFLKRFEDAKQLREKARFILSFYKDNPEVSKTFEFMDVDEYLFSTLQTHVDHIAPSPSASPAPSTAFPTLHKLSAPNDCLYKGLSYTSF